MKVALVAPSPIPFLIGGAEKFFIGMLTYLNQLSIHDVELIKVPCKDWEFWSLMEGYRKFSKLNLNHFDMVITTKYPAWMIKHPNHVIYMQHTCRGVYDLYHLTGKPFNWENLIDKDARLAPLKTLLKLEPTRERGEELLNFLQEIEKFKHDFEKGIFEFPGPLTRAIIQFLDRAALSPEGECGIKSYLAISKTVALREGYFPPGAKVKIAYHPSNLQGFHSESYDFIFTASRLEDLKRIDLLIKAFKQVKKDIKFLIAGTGGQEQKLKDLAKGDERIQFLGFVTDEELIQLYSRALFVPFIPYNEDYGLITIEAMQSEKAVLTTHDSGGVTELVKNGFNGLIVEPNETALAEAMEKLIIDRKSTIEMGKRAKKSVTPISWESVAVALFGKDAVKTKVSFTFPHVIVKSSKPEILVLSTFSILPPLSGGRKRIFYLYKNLEKSFNVTVLSLNHENKETKLSSSFREIRVKRTREFNKLADEIARKTGISSDDIAAIEGYRLIPEFIEKLNQLLKTASVVILSHPYLFYSVEKVSIPILYDAHNVEYKLKRMLTDNELFLNKVKEVESATCSKAELIYPTSLEDAEEFLRLYSVNRDKIFVVENGVDTHFAKPLPSEEKVALKNRLGIADKVVAVFTGSKHKPNQEALEYILKLATEFREVLFIIIGDIGETLNNSSLPNVIATGRLTEEEKDIVLKAADIGLNPVVSGSGTNLKLLEYLAYGLIVVSTHFGIRGIPKAKETVITCTPENLSESFKFAIQLLKEEKTVETLKFRARELAQQYDWRKLSKKLEEKILTLIN